MQRAAQAASIMYDEESDKLACQVPAQGQEQVPVPPGDWVAVHEIVYIVSNRSQPDYRLWVRIIPGWAGARGDFHLLEVCLPFRLCMECRWRMGVGGWCILCLGCV